MHATARYYIFRRNALFIQRFFALLSGRKVEPSANDIASPQTAGSFLFLAATAFLRSRRLNFSLPWRLNQHLKRFSALDETSVKINGYAVQDVQVNVTSQYALFSAFELRMCQSGFRKNNSEAMADRTPAGVSMSS